MDAKQFIEEYGREEAEKVAKNAGSNIAYFSQIANGHRNASFKLAAKLVEASGGRLDQFKLMSATHDRKVVAS